LTSTQRQPKLHEPWISTVAVGNEPAMNSHEARVLWASIVMLAPPEAPRYASRAKSEGRDLVEPRPRRMVQVFY